MPQFFSMEFDFGRPSCHPPANQAMSSPVVHLGFVIDPSAGVATLGLLADMARAGLVETGEPQRGETTELFKNFPWDIVGCSGHE